MNFRSNKLTLWRKLRDPEYRNAFVSSTVAARLAVRIYNLRKKSDLSQLQLAEKTGMKQARISVLEQGDYQNFTFSTLKKIAAAFQVAVIVDFVSFPDFMRWADNLKAESVTPETLEESLSAIGGPTGKGIVPPVQRSELTEDQREIPIEELTERQMWEKPKGIGTQVWTQ